MVGVPCFRYVSRAAYDAEQGGYKGRYEWYCVLSCLSIDCGRDTRTYKRRLAQHLYAGSIERRGLSVMYPCAFARHIGYSGCGIICVPCVKKVI